MKLKGKKTQCGQISKLSDLVVGDVAEIVKINTSEKMIRRRLFDMGITSGVRLEIKKIAPLGDPVGIKLRGYELCLRKSELKNVDVKVLK